MLDPRLRGGTIDANRFNQVGWDRLAREVNGWTRPVSGEEIERARSWRLVARSDTEQAGAAGVVR